MPSKDVKVIIVGAGVSGLSAATKLIEAGITNLEIFEASDRVGGRICSAELNGSKIELGAQWIHGQKGNSCFEIAKKLGICEDPAKETLEDLDATVVDEDGSFWDEDVAEEITDLFEEAQEDEEDYEQEQGETMGGYYDKIASKFLAGRSEDFRKKVLQYKDYFHRYHQSMDACDNWYEDSFEGTVHDYTDCEGNDMIALRGEHCYEDLLKRFLPEIPAGAISLDSKVEKIRLVGEKKVDIRLEDGRVSRADFVIVTISLGVLKSAEGLFVPKLPEEKRKAVEYMRFGTANKIHVDFGEDNVWWPLGGVYTCQTTEFF